LSAAALAAAVSASSSLFEVVASASSACNVNKTADWLTPQSAVGQVHITYLLTWLGCKPSTPP
jgi:hypothetical protein